MKWRRRRRRRRRRMMMMMMMMMIMIIISAEHTIKIQRFKQICWGITNVNKIFWAIQFTT
jgi:hypothetical protein